MSENSEQLFGSVQHNQGLGLHNLETAHPALRSMGNGRVSELLATEQPFEMPGDGRVPELPGTGRRPV